MRSALILFLSGLALAGGLTYPASAQAQGGVIPAEKALPAPTPPAPGPPPAPAAKQNQPIDLCFPRGVVCAPGSIRCCPPMTCGGGTPNVCQ